MWIFFLCYPSFSSGKGNISEIYPLKHASIDATNLASLQRGAKYFINFCSGCHSLRFIRYNQLAVDLKIIDKANSAADSQRLNNNLVFTQANPSNTIKPSLHKKDALLWFGKYPPDLSLSTRTRGIDWVYNYLLGFHQDNKRPFGVNNDLVRDTIMPDPLGILRTNTFSNRRIKSKINHDSRFKLFKTDNNLNYSLISSENQEFFVLEEVTTDLVNFLAYAADPSESMRKSLGIKVCAFLMVFLCLVYFLKKQIWGNNGNAIHKGTLDRT
ncbi:MAG: cytochrome c1 [Pseudomonadota bacterium]